MKKTVLQKIRETLQYIENLEKSLLEEKARSLKLGNALQKIKDREENESIVKDYELIGIVDEALENS